MNTLSTTINPRARDLLWRTFQVLEKTPGRTPEDQGVSKSELILALMRLADAEGPGSAERSFALDASAPAGEFKAFCEALERDHPERIVTWDAIAVYFAFLLEEPGADAATGGLSPSADPVTREERLARLGVVRAKTMAVSAFSTKTPPSVESGSSNGRGFSGAQRAKVRSANAFRSSSPSAPLQEGGMDGLAGPRESIDASPSERRGLSGAQRAKIRAVSSMGGTSAGSPSEGLGGGELNGHVGEDADVDRSRSPYVSLRVKTQAVTKLTRTPSERLRQAQEEDVSDIPVDRGVGSPTASAGSPRRALGKVRAATALSRGGRRESGTFGDGSPRSPEVASDSLQEYDN